MTEEAYNYCLTGRISFRLELAGGGGGKKRRRPPDDDDDPLLRPTKPDALPLAGWIFESTTRRESRCCYLLSVSRALLRKTCDACRSRQTVRISRHHRLLPFEKENGLRSSDPTALLEIDEVDALEIVPDSSSREGPRTEESTAPDDVWTLRQLARREALDAAESVRPSKSTLYCFSGLVSAVSPVITMDPNDPFALLELQDGGYTCVLVLRKEGLSCLPALVPGDSIRVRTVRKQKWRIPDVIGRRLKDRVPRCVFVVDSARQLDWDEGDRPPPPSFTPGSPLVSLEGRVDKVHMMKGSGETQKCIHYLELSALGETVAMYGNELSLFVTYFPMATNLQLSLRPGTVIQAMNIHRLGLDAFCACLRSNIVVVSVVTIPDEMAVSYVEYYTQPMDSVSNNHRHDSLLLSPNITAPYAFLRIRRSYLEFWCRNYMSKRTKEFPSSSQKRLPELDKLVRALLQDERRETSKALSRNAYAEFFDHAVDDSCVGMRSVSVDQDGCHMSIQESDGSTLPLPISVRNVQEAGLDVIQQRLREFTKLHSSKIYVGWTGSTLLAGKSMHDCVSEFAVESFASKKQQSLHVGGFAKMTSIDGMVFASLSNGCVELPVVFPSKTVDLANGVDRTSFVWARLRSVVLCCVCVSSTDLREDDQNADSCSSFMKKLPSFTDKANLGTSTNGPCALVEVNGFVFAVSLFLECDALKCVEGESTIGITEGESFERLASIENCLGRQSEQETLQGYLGLLTRQLFKVSKVKNDVNNGYLLTISHTPLEGVPSPDEISCLQTVELKPPVSVGRPNLSILRKTVESLTEAPVSDEQLALALVWWKLASCERTCSLLGGGWDELACGSCEMAGARGVLVRIPTSSVRHDPKRGYTRFRCLAEDLVATVRYVDGPSRRKDSFKTATSFDFIAGPKVLPGVLDRRPRRRRFGNVARGELFIKQVHAGIPTCRLVDLHWAICAELRTRDRSHLLPSMVREIRGATFMGISFCKAFAICCKCYETLNLPPGNEKKREQTSKQKNGVTKRALLDQERAQPTFWHRPLPGNPFQKDPNAVDTEKPASGNDSENDESVVESFTEHMQRTTPLRCPNRCSMTEYGIKWECSGTLDDGTGQAKLYTEREVALLLLGMSLSTVEVIEEGAWQKEDGIVFSRTMPPNSCLRSAVLTARNMALDQVARRERRRLEDEDVLRFMTVATRAEYMMQHHCRSSREPTRPLNYFVRCKPLSDDVCHLHQTDIEVAPGRDVATYKLPQLQLVLVDCCRPNRDEEWLSQLVACNEIHSTLK